MIFSCFFTDTGMEPLGLMISALLLLALASSIAVESVDPVFNDDVLGLIVFKSGLQDPKSKLSSWNEDDATPCSWDGVFCDRRSNRVAELRLDGFSLSGHIGRGVIRLQFLKVLSLSNNNFNGTIIADVTRIGTLQSIDLSHNNLTGSIPGELFQQCGSLRSVSFAGNRLTGPIPDSVSSCSSLLAVNFSSNQLSGQLPLGFWFSRPIQSIDISGNLLEGVIHDGVQSLYNLRILNLGRNRFVGRIPVDIGGCFNLRMLDLSSNFLSGGFPESMKQLSLLSSLSVSANSFTGKIPDWIGDLQNLERLDLSANSFVGRIPRSIGNIHSMKELNLSKNHFTGILPSSLSNFADIVVLDVSQNVLMGSFRLRSTTSEDTMFHDDYRNLQVLDLSSNAFSGQLPDDIGDLTSLRRLNMSRNHLFGSIPVTIGRLNATEVLDFSSNMLNGTIPLEIGGAVSLLELNLQKNFLTGNIPAEIEHCSSLTSLILSDNKLTGLVPSSIAKLSKLEHVDLSSNSLSGSLPKELADLSHLQNFNVSYNNLEGELPGGSYFDTIPLSFVYGNPLLCGSVVKDSCPSVHPKPIVLNPNSSTPAGASSSTYSPHKRIILSISALIAIGAAAFIAIGVVAVSLLNIHARSATQLSGPGIVFSGDEEFSCSPSTDPNYGKLVIFSGEAHFITAANGLLNKESELGRGGFGVVYKTILKDGRTFAIKKLTCSGLIKSQEEFETEVKSLGKIRHTNLISLEGYYWTPSLQLLIYEYIPLGSLYHQIHDSESRNCLSWRQRFDIILGMARGLAHLHQMNIIHYNLKSTNIIIDTSLQPKVGDFGLARLLPGLDRCILSSKIQSALGYMAPEFACRSVKITEKCDVYGFGVLILEIISGRRPVEYMEDDVSVLCDIVRSALEAGEVEKCVDVRLVGFPMEEAVPLMKLGLVCASQVPSTRPDMVEVINILELIQCSSEESL